MLVSRVKYTSINSILSAVQGNVLFINTIIGKMKIFILFDGRSLQVFFFFFFFKYKNWMLIKIKFCVGVVISMRGGHGDSHR